MSLHEVLARLRAIDRQLPHDDGVRRFNELYLEVTERVHAMLQEGGFEDAAFMERLDAVFADLYFDALDGSRSNPAQAAWRPLLAARADHEIAPERFMLAGINAHVNYDLPLALLDTSRELEGTLTDDTARHRDFQRIDDILREVEEEMHERLHTGRLEELIALWATVRARGRAWTAATELAELPASDDHRDRHLEQLASTVAGWSDLILHMPG